MADRRRIVYPGTFDPLTLGHLDLIRRACKLFDQVIVGVARGVHKQPLFTLEERVQLVQEVLIGQDFADQVEVQGFGRLLIDFIREHHAAYILRGMRAVSDFEMEFQLASTNRALAPDVETLFIMPDSKYAFISSSLVREVASLYGDTAAFVPEVVQRALRGKYPMKPHHCCA